MHFARWHAVESSLCHEKRPSRRKVTLPTFIKCGQRRGQGGKNSHGHLMRCCQCLHFVVLYLSNKQHILHKNITLYACITSLDNLKTLTWHTRHHFCWAVKKINYIHSPGKKKFSLWKTSHFIDTITDSLLSCRCRLPKWDWVLTLFKFYLITSVWQRRFYP